MLVVDEGEIKGCYYDVYTRKVKHIDSAEYDKSVIPINIISHLPLNGSPILEGVDLLPPLPLEEDVEKLAREYAQSTPDNDPIRILSYLKGYNQAKAKYKYTEEDLRKAIDRARDYCDGWVETKDEIVQSLSQPKMPTGFECVMEKDFRYNDDGEPFGFKVHNSDKITTTTTPEGHTQWVGKYIYE